jgi:hypothetical protein
VNPVVECVRVVGGVREDLVDDRVVAAELPDKGERERGGLLTGLQRAFAHEAPTGTRGTGPAGDRGQNVARRDTDAEGQATDAEQP